MPDFFDQPVICNTGPLIALSKVRLGHLLRALFPRVLTTRKVVEEATAKDAGDLQLVRGTLASLEIVEGTIPEPLLLTELDAGEASVIQAARDLKPAGVLIDERRARRIASAAYGLEVRGTCALLVRAKRRQLLPTVRHVLEEMSARGYFVGPVLHAETLRQAGE